jgi:hypothetical protein
MKTTAEIKQRMSLRDVAAMVGLELPKDGVKFRSPLRPDRTPSCTIQGDRMRDWSQGESYDCIAFFAACKQISTAEAIKLLAIQAGVATGNHGSAKPIPARHRGRLPSGVEFEERKPTDDDYAAILRTRKLPPESEPGLLLAHSVGVLRFGRVSGFDCWIVTDESTRVAEARRLDGRAFPAFGSLGERKAHTLKGSAKSWPVGLSLRLSQSRTAHLRRLPLLILEGGPDLLAAYALLATLPMDTTDVQPVAMLGSESSIGDNALPTVSGRPCIVVAHGDQAGRNAADKWALRLSAAGCRVSLRQLPDGCDLNDAVAAHGLEAMGGWITP